jgi:uncharacterized OB-fold protein
MWHEYLGTRWRIMTGRERRRRAEQVGMKHAWRRAGWGKWVHWECGVCGRLLLPSDPEDEVCYGPST